MKGFFARTVSRFSSAYLPEPSLETSPARDDSGRVVSYPEGTQLKGLILGQFRRVGIDTRHLREFAATFRTSGWPLWMHNDFWGAQAGQMAPDLGPFSSVMPSNVTAMPNFSEWAAEVRGMNEVLRWGLYDRVAYATGGQSTLTFFQNSPNSGFQITNMLQPGALPGNQSQLVMGIRFDLESSQTDIISGVAFQQKTGVVLGKNWVEFTIATKTYVRESPIAKLAPGYGVIGTPGLIAGGGAGLQTAPSNAQIGTPDRNAIWNLNIPIGILPTRTFNTTANWNPVAAVTTAATMVCELDGLMLRAAQ